MYICTDKEANFKLFKYEIYKASINCCIISSYYS